jgi:SnoaL-like domain
MRLLGSATLLRSGLCAKRYAQAVDAGDGVAFASVFTPDGHLVSNYEGNETHFNGREQLAQIPEAAKVGALTTMHFIGISRISTAIWPRA